METKYKVIASSNIQDLTGNGIEYLTDETGEKLRAIFIDGNFQRQDPKASAEHAALDTAICA